MITLKTLPQATEQEVFDQIATHLLTQNKKARNKLDTRCNYKSADGLSCAAGCLIADDEYDESFEANGWCALSSSNEVPREHDYLIDNLQTLHDESAVKDWKHDLVEFAKQHNLNTDNEIFKKSKHDA